MMMKNNNNLRLLIGLTLLIGGLCLTACKEEFDELSGGAENLRFTQLMEATPYASADFLIMSENSQNIIIAQRDEGTSYTTYFSVDGGESFEPISGGEFGAIDTYLSNDGKFIINNAVYQLKPGEASNAVYYTGSAFGLTANGKVLSYQYDENIGQNTYFIFENGAYVSSGIPDVIDPAVGFISTSGTKAGFLANNTIAEFDVSTMQFTKRPYPGGNMPIINKSNGIQGTYSQGYFAIAGSGGLKIISPSDQATIYFYPEEYQIYKQTRGRMFMHKDKVHVQLEAYYGELETYVTTGISGEETVISDDKFPIAANNETTVSQGFIDGGKRLEGGLIVDKQGVKSYLDLSIRSSVPETAFKVGNYLYMNDKRFDIDAKTFHLTEMGNILNVYHDENQTIAYTATGTYTSKDDKNWTLQTDTQPKPNLIAKDEQGTYHALGIQFAPYTLGGTGFTVPQFNQNAYISNDGINWQLIDEKSGMTGRGPTAMTPDGSVGYTFNVTPLSNATLYRNYSFDYGLTYEGFPAGTEPASYKVFAHQTANGHYVSANFESSDGLLYIEICENNKTSCKEITITAPIDTKTAYASADISFTPDDRILIINEEDGIYLTSKL